MSATFSELKTAVASAIRDPDNKTFDSAALAQIINEALSEVGRVNPIQFQEDITPVADTLQYTLQSAAFAAEAQPDIEVMRVEVWDDSTTPSTRKFVVTPASSGRAFDSQAGWTNWGGILMLPSAVFNVISGNEDSLTIKVWGYSPHPALSGDSDIASVTGDSYWALISRARLAAMEMLLNDRNLFTQWQTRSGNSDISPAGLMNELAQARDEWRRRSRTLLRLRSAV